jgi:hypothetical protein
VTGVVVGLEYRGGIGVFLLEHMEGETMQPSTILAEPTRELAHRVSNGLEVTLLWSVRDGRLAVTVSDGSTGELFELEAPREKALDVFHHPFFYLGFTTPASSRPEVPAW